MNAKSALRKINSLEHEYSKYTDKELVNKTIEFRKLLSNNQKKLLQILPEAYAVVREATKRVTGKRLYDVQIIGGYYLSQEKIAEIKAGEGKTLIQSMPAYLNALEGNGVNVITTNEYLAERDFKEVGSILKFLGLSVGFIYQGMDKNERKEAYKKDITYGTNVEFGFDYLRDNISYDKDELVQQKLNYALIDEADSILLDEAQTPMIISQKKHKEDPKPYIKADNFVKSLSGISVLKEEPKNEKQLKEIEKYDYVIYENYKNIELTQKGIKKAEEEYNLNNLYETDNVDIMNYIRQALRANKIFKIDEDYIVRDNQILLVDKFTGRIMKGKRYTNGLQEAIEIKEGLEIGESSEIVASITTQNYFKMYKQISGMTGTAKESEKEFNEMYSLVVEKVPLNRKCIRKDKKDVICLDEQEKYNTVIEDVKKSNLKGQPVLIGTTSIEKSEELSKLLTKNNIKHRVLNAKRDKEEAKIVEEAGKYGNVTIATNMAGRGTNILLGGKSNEEREKVINSGGLKVIGTEKHISRRIDEQLRGRSGRQGEIGESIFYLSLDDELIHLYGKRKIINKCKNKKVVRIKSRKIKSEIRKAQKRAEAINYSCRKRMVQYDDILNAHKEIIYRDRKKVLNGNYEDTIENFIQYFLNQVTKEQGNKSKKVLESIQKEENIIINKENLDDTLEKVLKRLENKKEELGEMKYNKSLRYKLLKIIDDNWNMHLEEMEDIRLNMELRAYGGHNPIEEYEKEGRKILETTVYKIKMNFVNQLLFNSNYL